MQALTGAAVGPTSRHLLLLLFLQLPCEHETGGLLLCLSSARPLLLLLLLLLLQSDRLCGRETTKHTTDMSPSIAVGGPQQCCWLTRPVTSQCTQESG